MTHDNLFTSDKGAGDYLVSIGQGERDDIDIIEVAFAFSLIDKPDADIAQYREKILAMSDMLGAHFEKLCATHNSDDVTIQAKALEETLGFDGDEDTYNSEKNFNLFDVMDRKKGIPVSLCILSVGLARQQGWLASGINFPGHFLMQLEQEGDRIIVDPFQGFKILEARDMRHIVKKIIGDHAELSAGYYQSCSDVDMLLRLQNNKKYRLIDHQKYQRALDIVETMAWLAPDDYRLWLDKAVLFARLDQTQAAIDNIKLYINAVENDVDRADALDFLYQLQSRLN